MGKTNPYRSEWIELYESGKSNVEIAEKFNTAPKTVWQALSRWGIEMRKSKFGSVHEEWVSRYLAGESMGSIAKDYGTDAANVHFTLRQKGVECRQSTEMIKHEELLKYHAEWIELYKGGMSAPKIAMKYGEDDTTVWRVIRDSDAEMRKSGETNQKYFVQNDHVFDVIDNTDKAYWLGFLMADGNIYGRNEGDERLLQVNLSEIDENHIDKLREFLVTDAPKTPVEKTKAIHFKVSSSTLAKGLINQGCVPRKSLIIQYPKIPDELQWSFVLGYFDGNGSVFKSKTKGNKYGVSVAISCGSEDFIAKLQVVMLRLAGLSNISLFRVKNVNTFGLSVIRKADIHKLHEWFYANATTYLDRKKLKYDELINNKGF